MTTFDADLANLLRTAIVAAVETYEGLAKDGHKPARIALSWGKQAPDAPEHTNARHARADAVHHGPKTAHTTLAFQAAWDTHQHAFMDGVGPLMDTLTARIPALQGPASEAAIIFAVRGVFSGPHHAAFKLRLNHCWIQRPNRRDDADNTHDLSTLLGFIDATTACGPAVHHYTTDTSLVSAACAQDARVFLQAADPNRWPTMPTLASVQQVVRPRA